MFCFRRITAALVAAFLTVASLAGCGGGGGVSGGLGSLPVINPAPIIGGGQPGAPTERVSWTINLAELGIVPDSQGRSVAGTYDDYFFEVSLSYVGDSAGGSAYQQVPVAADGTATITAKLHVGRWRLDQMAVTRYGRLVLVSTAPVEFEVAVGQNTPVAVMLVEATGTATFTVGLGGSSSDFQIGEDLVSHDGERLSRTGTHRFTWTPTGTPGATSCRLYLDLLHVDSTGGDGNYVPADVVVTNLDPTTMGTLTATNTIGGQTLTRITAINAMPGTTVEFTVELQPWPPYAATDYNRLQFGRVDNVQPPGVNYRVVGILPIDEQ